MFCEHLRLFNRGKQQRKVALLQNTSKRLLISLVNNSARCKSRNLLVSFD